MKNIIFIFVSFLFIFSVNAQKIEQKPNIIIFLVDDMGWQDTSVPFWDKQTPNNQLYYTPNMQRLVNSGVKFTQGYGAEIGRASCRERV